MEDYVAACKELEAFSLSYIILCAGQNTFYSCWKINLLSLPFLTYYNVLVIKSFLPLFLPVFIFTVLFSTICLCLTLAHDFINFALLLVASEYICKITFLNVVYHHIEYLMKIVLSRIQHLDWTLISTVRSFNCQFVLNKRSAILCIVNNWECCFCKTTLTFAIITSLHMNS